MPLFEKPVEHIPSLIGVFFCAILVAFVGAVSGFLLLLSASPAPFDSVADYESAKEESVGKPTLLDAYYYRGSEAEGDSWMAKRETLLTGSNTTVEFTDAELNAWITEIFSKLSTASTLEQKPDIYIAPGQPNFFIDPVEGLSFSLLLELFTFKKKHSCILICKGGFSGEDSTRFEPTSLRFNEAVVPSPVGLKTRLLSEVLETFGEIDELIELEKAWEKVESVELVENQIRINIGS